ncbi:hypothetical protein ACK3TF_003052 [Chlorella vulgaris]
MLQMSNVCKCKQYICLVSRQARQQVPFTRLRRRQGGKRDNRIDTDDCYASQTVMAGIIELLIALGCNIILRQLRDSGKLQRLHPHLVPLAEQCHYAKKPACNNIYDHCVMRRTADTNCIPVLIHDEVKPSWTSLLAVETYSVGIAHNDMERVPDILRAFSEKEIARMQANVARVWRRRV